MRPVLVDVRDGSGEGGHGAHGEGEREVLCGICCWRCWEYMRFEEVGIRKGRRVWAAVVGLRRGDEGGERLFVAEELHVG